MEKLISEIDIETFINVASKAIDDVILIVGNENFDMTLDDFVEAIMYNVIIKGYIPLGKEHYITLIDKDTRLQIRGNNVYLKDFSHLNVKLKYMIETEKDITLTEEEGKIYDIVENIAKLNNWKDLSGGKINYDVMRIAFPLMKEYLGIQMKASKPNIKTLSDLFFSKIHYKIKDDEVYL